MYEQFLNLIKNDADGITKKLLGMLEKDKELRYYISIPADVREERILNVILCMCEQLGSAMNRSTWKQNVISHYSLVGANRCREGIPLEEVVRVFQLIKRCIWHDLKDKVVINNSFTLKNLRDMQITYDVFFDRVIHSLVAGFQGELKHLLEQGRECRLKAKKQGKDTD